MKTILALAGLGLALTAGAAVAGDEAAPKVKTERHVVVIGDGPGKMDKNGDGEITRDEFMAPHAEMFGKLDADKNGKLSKDELSKGGEDHHVFLHGPDGPRGPHGRGGHHMRVLELHHGGEGPGELDANKDGKISPEEFAAPMKKAFEAMDADKSGFLEEGERAKGPMRFEHRVERVEKK